MTMQVYSTALGNPSGIVPKNPQLPDIYYTPDTTGIQVMFGWDVPNQCWKQYTPSQQIYVGAIVAPDTVPTISPLNPFLPAFYKDLTGGVIFTWNPGTSTWI